MAPHKVPRQRTGPEMPNTPHPPNWVSELRQGPQEPIGGTHPRPCPQGWAGTYQATTPGPLPRQRNIYGTCA